MEHDEEIELAYLNIKGRGLWFGFPSDIVAKLVFENHSAAIDGFENREKLRTMRPTLYELLDEVKSVDDFAGMIARIKLEMEETK